VSPSKKRGDAQGFVEGRVATLHPTADQRVSRGTVAMGKVQTTTVFQWMKDCCSVDNELPAERADAPQN
jgi:hypothetical protein